MYEQFGFTDSREGQQINLFVPYNTVDPTQYTGNKPAHIVEVRLVGDFQSRVNGKAINWDYVTGLIMDQKPHPNGLYKNPSPGRNVYPANQGFQYQPGPHHPGPYHPFA